MQLLLTPYSTRSVEQLLKVCAESTRFMSELPQIISLSIIPAVATRAEYLLDEVPAAAAER
jgi:hypothetical protein